LFSRVRPTFKSKKLKFSRSQSKHLFTQIMFTCASEIGKMQESIFIGKVAIWSFSTTGTRRTGVRKRLSTGIYDCKAMSSRSWNYIKDSHLTKRWK
jgi:hypothetical protein